MQSLRLAASLAVYWFSTFFGGRLRVRWARWAYTLDHRNKLALHDLVERRPREDEGAAQTSLQRWTHSIVQRDPLAFANAVENSATNEVERAQASLVSWAHRCSAQDAISIFGVATGNQPPGAEQPGAPRYPWAYLAQRNEVRLMLELAERAASTDADKTRAWLARWAQSLETEELLAIHLATADSERGENPRVDAFFAFVAAKTEAERHPQAHLAQRFAVDSRDPKHDRSTSQLAQDRFVLFALGERRRDGFFVEFGATDGLELSNTYLLEREFGWNGILAEPNPAYHTALRRNRRCNISDDCVWSRSGETVRFQVVESYPPLSTMAEFQDSDQHDRSGATTIEVPTITLNDLLKQHDAPRHIDYISIDTEGSELAILEAFDFSAYEVSAFTIEHNFGPAREKIQRLMQRHGYVRVFPAFSRWDDWYVSAESAARLNFAASSKPLVRIAV
jgi:FkbM family methyltransferase